MATQTAQYLTGDAAFAVDQSGLIVLWNKAAEMCFGYPECEAMGGHCWELLCGRDVFNNAYCGAHCPSREMAFKHELVNHFYMSFKTENGYKPFSVSCLMMYGEPGIEWLLHLCHPQKATGKRFSNPAIPVPTEHQPGKFLTRRESEVLGYLKDGKSTDQIAASMKISCTTVRNHIQHILRKLNVHNRLEAVLKGNGHDPH